MARHNTLTNGPAAAAIVAAGIGSFAQGLFTTLAQASVPVKEALDFYGPAGPLSGKTTLAIVVWLAVWTVLYGLWKNKQVGLARVLLATWILIALGLLGTFPPFYEWFGG